MINESERARARESGGGREEMCGDVCVRARARVCVYKPPPEDRHGQRKKTKDEKGKWWVIRCSCTCQEMVINV